MPRRTVCLKGIVLFLFCLIFCDCLPGMEPADYFSYYKDYAKVKEVPPPEKLNEIALVFHSPVPSVQQAGYLIAQKNGFYKQEGLPPVAIRWIGNSRIDGTMQLQQGKAHFYTLSLPRAYIANGLGIKNAVIALISPNPDFALMVRTDLTPQITEFKHLDKLRIGVGIRLDEYPILLFAHNKISFEPIITLNDGTTLLRKGVIDALFVTSHGAQIFKNFSKNRENILLFPYQSSDFHLPGECLTCMKSFLFKHPEVCQKFIRATYRGYLYASKNPKEALGVLEKAYKENHIVFDQFIVKKQLDIWFREMELNPALEANGDWSEKDFNTLRSCLTESKILDAKQGADYRKFFYPVLLSPTLERINKEKQSCRD
ncbi:MAG: ABC transporter substrate-binding protein [Planctomycetia bacterium]|nr:ABC transporter substrate-binding protein [Planctomycetia bacterium]